MGRNLGGRIASVKGISLVTTRQVFFISTEPKNVRVFLVTDVSQTLYNGRRPWTKHEYNRSNLDNYTIQSTEPYASAPTLGAEP